MRIAIISGSVPTTTFIDGLINTMADEGFEMVVIGKKTGSYSYGENVTVVVVPEDFTGRIMFIIKQLLQAGFRHLGKIYRSSKSLKHFYKDLLFYLPIISARPDKIHIQWTAFIHDKDLLFELFPGKIIVSMRGAHINYTPITTPAIRESYLRLFPEVHRFHAVSEAIAKEAEQYHADRDKIQVIYSFVDDALLSEEIQPKPQNEKLRVISVGRFFWKKGYEYALDAMAKLKEHGVLFTYTLIAEGKTPAAIIYQLHQLGLNDDVQIINGLSHSEVIKQTKEHDVLLLPSVEEGIANVVLEAMATGTPVISTNVGGMSEVVDDNINGFLVQARNVDEIADALISFNKLDKEERFAIAKAAKEKVRMQHNPEVFRKKFSELYKS